MPQWFVSFVSTGAKVGFGMYLGQTVALEIVDLGVTALSLPTVWNFVTLPLVFIIVVAVDYGMSLCFFKIPPFGFLVGRPQWHVSRLWSAK